LSSLVVLPVLSKTLFSIVNIKGSNITSNSNGSNAVFATGEGSVINVENTNIHTKSDSSRGLDATYKGFDFNWAILDTEDYCILTAEIAVVIACSVACFIENAIRIDDKHNG